MNSKEQGPYRTKIYEYESELDPEKECICWHSEELDENAVLQIFLMEVSESNGARRFHTINRVFQRKSRRSHKDEYATYIYNSGDWIWLERKIVAAHKTWNIMNKNEKVYKVLKRQDLVK